MENSSHNNFPRKIPVAVRNYLIELLIYIFLVVGYFLLALRYLNNY